MKTKFTLLFCLFTILAISCNTENKKKEPTKKTTTVAKTQLSNNDILNKVVKTLQKKSIKLSSEQIQKIENYIAKENTGLSPVLIKKSVRKYLVSDVLTEEQIVNFR